MQGGRINPGWDVSPLQGIMHIQTRIHTQGQFSIANLPTGIFWTVGKNQENLEETHKNMVRTCIT